MDFDDVSTENDNNENFLISGCDFAKCASCQMDKWIHKTYVFFSSTISICWNLVATIIIKNAVKKIIDNVLNNNDCLIVYLFKFCMECNKQTLQLAFIEKVY